LAIFLYVYASLPQDIVIYEGQGAVMLTREALFYFALTIFALINVLVFVVSRLYSKSAEDFLCWFYGLVMCLNVFLIIALNFINLYNSNEKFDYDRIGYIIYGSLGLFVLWAIGWPFYLLSRKILNKQSL